MEIGESVQQIGVALVLRQSTSLMCGIEPDSKRGSDRDPNSEQRDEHFPKFVSHPNPPGMRPRHGIRKPEPQGVLSPMPRESRPISLYPLPTAALSFAFLDTHGKPPPP